MYLTWIVKHGRHGHTAESLDALLSGVTGRRAYNLLYLPFSHKRGRSARYFFVNFVDADSAVAFLTHISGKLWSAFDANATNSKIVEVEPAEVQGIRNSIQWCMDSLEAEEANGPRVLMISHRGAHRLNIYEAFWVYCGMVDTVAPRHPQTGELSMALGQYGLPRSGMASQVEVVDAQ